MRDGMAGDGSRGWGKARSFAVNRVRVRSGYVSHIGMRLSPIGMLLRRVTLPDGRGVSTAPRPLCPARPRSGRP